MLELSIQNIKTVLKRSVWISAVNARFKAFQAKVVYQNTIRHYAKKRIVSPFLPLLAHRLGSRAIAIREARERLRIFYLGTDALQDRSGILQTLARIGELTYFTKGDGDYGQHIAGSVDQRRLVNTNRLLELFRLLHEQGKAPHLLIAQTFASYIYPWVFSQLRECYGTVVVNISMDDRHQYWGSRINGEWGGTYDLIPHIDMALTTSPECVDWYLKEGCPAIFFPEASDPTLFYPMPNLPKIHDVSFVGRRYGIREKIVMALRDAGVRVTAYGDGWESGHIEVDEVPKLFAQSKVVLGIGTIGHGTDFYALKMRDFDGPMSGSLYVTHDNPDLHRLFAVGAEIVTYESVQDCIDKVKYYLQRESEREKIALAGCLAARRDHTWQKRFEGLFNLLTEQWPCAF